MPPGGATRRFGSNLAAYVGPSDHGRTESTREPVVGLCRPRVRTATQVRDAVHRRHTDTGGMGNRSDGQSRAFAESHGVPLLISLFKAYDLRRLRIPVVEGSTKVGRRAW